MNPGLQYARSLPFYNYKPIFHRGQLFYFLFPHLFSVSERLSVIRLQFSVERSDDTNNRKTDDIEGEKKMKVKEFPISPCLGVDEMSSSFLSGTSSAKNNFCFLISVSQRL